MDQWDGRDRRAEPRPADRLTESEVEQLRRIMEADRSAKLLWASIRNLAVWIAAVSTAIGVGYQGLTDMIKHMAGK